MFVGEFYQVLFRAAFVDKDSGDYCVLGMLHQSSVITVCQFLHRSSTVFCSRIISCSKFWHRHNSSPHNCICAHCCFLGVLSWFQDSSVRFRGMSFLLCSRAMLPTLYWYLSPSTHLPRCLVQSHSGWALGDQELMLLCPNGSVTVFWWNNCWTWLDTKADFILLIYLFFWNF